jgi:RNA-binding protein
MLDNKQKKYLKGQAHHLKQVVQIGSNGVTAKLIKEVLQALTAHELIKIQVQHDKKQVRQQLSEEVCAQSQAQFVQLIGKQAIVFKQAKTDSKFKLP